MAIVINLGDRRMGSGHFRPAPAEGAKIMLFTGVRFERLDTPSPQDGVSAAQAAEDQALRNRTG